MKTNNINTSLQSIKLLEKAKKALHKRVFDYVPYNKEDNTNVIIVLEDENNIVIEQDEEFLFYELNGFKAIEFRVGVTNNCYPRKKLMLEQLQAEIDNMKREIASIFTHSVNVNNQNKTETHILSNNINLNFDEDDFLETVEDYINLFIESSTVIVTDYTLNKTATLKVTRNKFKKQTTTITFKLAEKYS